MSDTSRTDLAFDDELGWLHKDSLAVVNEMRQTISDLESELGKARHDSVALQLALVDQQELNVRLEREKDHQNARAQLAFNERDEQSRLKHNCIAELNRETMKRVEMGQTITDLEASRALANEGAAKLAETNNRLRDDCAEWAAKSSAWSECAELLRFDIAETVAENLHLADGDHCTLWRLKRALAEFYRLKGKS
jgi:hypothetical protein